MSPDAASCSRFVVRPYITDQRPHFLLISLQLLSQLLNTVFSRYKHTNYSRVLICVNRSRARYTTGTDNGLLWFASRRPLTERYVHQV